MRSQFRSRAVSVACVVAIAGSASAQPGYTFSNLPGLFPAANPSDRLTSLTLADPDVGGPLPTQLIAVGGLRTSLGSGSEWAARWNGTAWVPLTPLPPGLTPNNVGVTLRATNLGGRLRVNGPVFPGSAGLVTYSAGSWTSTSINGLSYSNPAAITPSALVLSSGNSSSFPVFDGISVVQTIPAPNWFNYASAPTSSTRGTVSIFGQLYCFGGVGENNIVNTPTVLFYTGTGANPWIQLTTAPAFNAGEPTAVESIQGDLYMATRSDFGTASVGGLYVRRNASPNSWQRVATFAQNSTNFSPNGVLALSAVVVGGTTWLVVGGAFDNVIPDGSSTPITNVGGSILYDGSAFVRMDAGFGGIVRSITTTDFRTIYLGGVTNDANVAPLVRAWNPPVVPTCYANCDASTVAPVLNAGDFGCFIIRFREASSLGVSQQITSYANCDASTVPPVLNAGDFGCFLTRFRSGCP